MGAIATADVETSNIFKILEHDDDDIPGFSSIEIQDIAAERDRHSLSAELEAEAAEARAIQAITGGTTRHPALGATFRTLTSTSSSNIE